MFRSLEVPAPSELPERTAGSHRRSPSRIVVTWMQAIASTLVAWVLPPLCNSWILSVIWLYKALNVTPGIDCYRVGPVPSLLRQFQAKSIGATRPDVSIWRVCSDCFLGVLTV